MRAVPPSRRLMPVIAALFLAWLTCSARAADEAAVERGDAVFNAADCVGCHTDVKGGGKRLAGGRPLATPFGTFFSPNITPDKETGIGAWSLADFERALRHGVSPEGGYYFPVFPYPSFTKLRDEDVADLYAYLMAQPPVAQRNKRHQVGLPFRWRFLQAGWRLLFFDEGRFQPVAGKDAEWNRGAYLVEAAAHCGECHTPRNLLGGLKTSRFLSGDPHGPDGQKVPNITSDPESGIGKWSVDDIVELLKSGQTPEFDFVGGGMGEVVNGTKLLSDADRRAIAVFIKSVPPISTPKPPPGEGKKTS
jgi:mono/diheme cytochrome c family protein